MSEFPIHELIFEGPADLSNRTLQSLRTLFIEDLKYSAEDTQRYFKAAPIGIMRSEFQPELELFAKKIREAGGKCSIRSPQKRKLKESKPEPVAQKEVGKRVSFDTNESFWQPDKGSGENVLKAAGDTEDAQAKPLDLDLGSPLLSKPLAQPVANSNTQSAASAKTSPEAAVQTLGTAAKAADKPVAAKQPTGTAQQLTGTAKQLTSTAQQQTHTAAPIEDGPLFIDFDLPATDVSGPKGPTAKK